MVTITCAGCGGSVSAQRRTRRWCDSCSTRRQTLAAGPIERVCPACKATFVLERGDRANCRRYCRAECARVGASRSKLASKQRRARGERAPGCRGRQQVLADGERERRRRETRQERWFRHHPHRARVCEALGCREDRVVELAHKPGRERRGANPSLDNTRDQDVWVLCPTCHRVLDLGIQTAAELGLV